MKSKLSIIAFTITVFFISCQSSSNSAKDSGDTTSIYNTSGDSVNTTINQDTVIDRGMGDSAGVQGGTKTNVGTDTVGKQPHDH